MDFALDVPYAEVQQAPVTGSMLAQAGNPKPIVINQECKEVSNSEDDFDSAANQVEVRATVLRSLGYRYDKSIHDFVLPDSVRENFKMYVQTAPRHGQLVLNARGIAGSYGYQASPAMSDLTHSPLAWIPKEEAAPIFTST